METKKEIVENLQRTIATKRGKTLPTAILDRVNYTLKKAKESLANVTKNDLTEVMNEVMNALTAPVAVAAPVANSTKLKAPAPKTKAEKPAPKTKAEKPAPKKVEEAKDALGKPFAKSFPDTLDVENVGTLKKSTMTYDEISGMENVYLAAYWNKRLIKEFSYETARQVKIPKGKFPNDLDILVPIVFCETVKRGFALSVYTEALFQFEAEDFEYITDKDGEGNEFQIRVSAGLEFEVYVLA